MVEGDSYADPGNFGVDVLSSISRDVGTLRRPNDSIHASSIFCKPRVARARLSKNSTAASERE
jgi:hypothetical protein